MLRMDVVVSEQGTKSLRMVWEPEHNEGRGFLGNEIAALGSEMVRLREQIVGLTYRLKGKQIGKKTPDAIRTRHEQDQKALDWAVNRLAVVEGRRAGLLMLEKEVFGGP